MTDALRVLAAVMKRIWRGQLHLQSAYLAELQPWDQDRVKHLPLHWRRRGRE